MTTVTRLPVETAFVAMLRDNLSQTVFYADSGAAEEHGIPPVDTTPPYVVVYGIPGGDMSGPPLTAPEADSEVYFQATCVGGTASQAVWMSDKVREIVVGRQATGSFTVPLTINGAAVLDRYSEFGLPAAVQSGTLWQAAARYCVVVTPE